MMHKINKYNEKMNCENNKNKIAYYQQKINHYNRFIQIQPQVGGTPIYQVGGVNICDDILDTLKTLKKILLREKNVSQKMLQK